MSNITGAAGTSNGTILCVGVGTNWAEQNATVQVGQTVNVTFGINTTQVPGPYTVFAGYSHGNGTWFERLQCFAPGNATNGNGLANVGTSGPIRAYIDSPWFNYTFTEATALGVSGQVGQPGDSVVFTAQPVSWGNETAWPFFVSSNYTIEASASDAIYAVQWPGLLGLLAVAISALVRSVNL